MTEPIAHIPNTCAGYVAAFQSQHGRLPTHQDIWDGAIRSYCNRTPAPVGVEPVALLVRKNSWRDGQWEAAPPNSPSYGLGWANQRVYVYTTRQPTQAQAGAVPLTPEAINSMAREADPCGDDGRLVSLAMLTPGTLERFAALVAAAEREACAQVAMEFRRGAGDPVCGEVAAAIRARGTP